MERKEGRNTERKEERRKNRRNGRHLDIKADGQKGKWT